MPCPNDTITIGRHADINNINPYVPKLTILRDPVAEERVNGLCRIQQM
jgi:hypothetical protein